MTKPRKGLFSVAPEYRSRLPEARDITWDDDFFQNDEDVAGIVAVFDFDYDQMVGFQTQTKALGQFVIVGFGMAYCYIIVLMFETEPVMALLASFLLPLAVYVMTLAPCLLKEQVKWEVYAQHVVVTRDGIRFVQNKRPSCWGLPICDRGKHSKTVPFDKITDCDIVEPAGNTCLVIPNVLMVVNVDTASSGGEGKAHELVLSGLVDPYAFKKLVWAMKRANESGGSYSYHAPKMVEMASMARDNNTINVDKMMEGGCSDVNSHDIPGLLRDIRDELRQNNDLLRREREMKESTNPTAPEIV